VLTAELGERPEAFVCHDKRLLGAAEGPAVTAVVPRPAWLGGILQPDKHGEPGRDVPSSLDGQHWDDARDPAQVATAPSSTCGANDDAIVSADATVEPVTA
jgi:hypothetical protein